MSVDPHLGQKGLWDSSGCASSSIFAIAVLGGEFTRSLYRMSTLERGTIARSGDRSYYAGSADSPHTQVHQARIRGGAPVGCRSRMVRAVLPKPLHAMDPRSRGSSNLLADHEEHPTPVYQTRYHR